MDEYAEMNISNDPIKLRSLVDHSKSCPECLGRFESWEKSAKLELEEEQAAIADRDRFWLEVVETNGSEASQDVPPSPAVTALLAEGLVEGAQPCRSETTEQLDVTRRRAGNLPYLGTDAANEAVVENGKEPHDAGKTEIDQGRNAETVANGEDETLVRRGAELVRQLSVRTPPVKKHLSLAQQKTAAHLLQARVAELEKNDLQVARDLSARLAAVARARRAVSKKDTRIDALRKAKRETAEKAKKFRKEASAGKKQLRELQKDLTEARRQNEALRKQLKEAAEREAQLRAENAEMMLHLDPLASRSQEEPQTATKKRKATPEVLKNSKKLRNKN